MHRTETDNEPEQLPAALIAELRRADSEVRVISSRIDRDVLKAADEQFSSRPPGQKPRLAAPVWAAMAASLVLAFVFVAGDFQKSADMAESASLRNTGIHSDLDGSGSVDIADVLLAAKMAGDDEVSRQQVEQFARRIVKLADKGGAS